MIQEDAFGVAVVCQRFTYTPNLAPGGGLIVPFLNIGSKKRLRRVVAATAFGGIIGMYWSRIKTNSFSACFLYSFRNSCPAIYEKEDSDVST